MENNNDRLLHSDCKQAEAHVFVECENPAERRLTQVKGQLSRKKPIKEIVILILTLALIIFAIVPFLVTAVVVLFYSLSH